MCPAPALPHITQHQPSSCLLTQLSRPKSGGKDSWRDDLQPMGSLMGGEQEHYTKNSDPSFLLLLQGLLIFPWGKVQVRQQLGARESHTSSCIPGMLRELCRATSLSHFFICSICRHLSPQITPCPGGLMKHRRYFWTVQPDQQPMVAGTSPGKRAALFLAASHPLDNHFHGRSRPEAEDTRDYI